MIGTAAGRAVGFDDVGVGEPLLFVHGFPLDRTMWAPQTSAIGAHARCLALDLPGFGESAPADVPATMDGYADAIVAFLDSLGIDRATICGLSMGGYVAFALWRRHPERVRALVLASTRARPDDAAMRERRLELAAVAAREGADAVADRQLPGLLGKRTRARRPDLVDAMRRILVAAPADGVVAALAAMSTRPDSTPTLPTITVPTLFVCGTDDAITGPAEMRAMHERVPGSTIEMIEGAGHACSFERPAAFNHVLTGFLGSLGMS